MALYVAVQQFRKADRMASIFGFRSRDPARDRQTDLQRFDRLAKLFDQISAEIEAEKAGLENRYRSTATNAAFLVEAMENGSASTDKSSDVSAMTGAILNYERRIAELARQKGLMKELRHSLDAIVDDGGGRSGSQAGQALSAGRS
ncbi:conserved hypothetical protein [Mesorhizobium sp. ORS 3324]|nr:conserved hypothetical protein [Mesorhizobium sp. ORS 3324]